MSVSAVPKRASKATRPRAAAPTTADPIEIAMEAVANPRPAVGVAHRVLAKQEQLIGWQIASERAGFVLKVAMGLAGLVLAAVVGWMVWTASRADGLVVEGVSVPPALVQRGVTGEAVAHGLVDELARISAASNASERQRQASSAGDAAVSIEIPNTGVSIGQLEQWLRQKLGRQEVVSAELSVGQGGDLTLASRVGGTPLAAQTGGAEDLPKLIHATAEAIYRLKQPYSYSSYLRQQGEAREAEMRAFLKELIASPNPRMQALGWHQLAIAVQRTESEPLAAEYYQRSRSIGLAYAPSATGNLGGIELNRGRWESALALRRQNDRLQMRDPGIAKEVRESRHIGTAANEASMLGDMSAALAGYQKQAKLSVAGQLDDPASAHLTMARTYAALHDLAAARETRVRYEAAVKNRNSGIEATADIVIATAAEDWPVALAAVQVQDANLQARGDKGSERQAVRAAAAMALLGAGQAAEAQARIAGTRLDCVPCLIARGRIAEKLGDRAGAERWLRQAKAISLHFPQADFALGEVRLKRGDARGAEAAFREALKIQPRHADSREGLAQALLAQGDARGAVRSFKAAADLAPNWGRLHLKWGEALARAGKAAEAKAQFSKAGGLYLTAEERAELNRVRGAG